jgi:hypothetical protein
VADDEKPKVHEQDPTLTCAVCGREGTRAFITLPGDAHCCVSENACDARIRRQDRARRRTVRIYQDPPRLLAKRSEQGYTSDRFRAMRDEPENVDKLFLAQVRRYADMTWQQEQAVRTASRDIDRDNLRAEDRLKDARRVAKMRHINLSGEFMVINRLIRQGKDAKAELRLCKVEDDLHGQQAA